MLLCQFLGAVSARAADFVAGQLQYRQPDGWTVEGRGSQLNLVSPSEDAFAVFIVLAAGDDMAVRSQAAQALAINLADLTVADAGRRGSINGMPALYMQGSGSSDATSVQFRAVVVTPRGKAPVLVLAYTTPDNFPALTPLFEQLFQSLKPRQ